MQANIGNGGQYGKDIQQNRLWNFRQIVNSVGGTNEAARIMGKKNSYITQIAGPNPSRSIGNRMVATIEKSFALDPGALDLAPPIEARGEDKHMAELSSVLANASKEDREIVIEIARLFAKRSLRIKPDDL